MAKRYYTSSADARTLNGSITGSPTPSTTITLNTVTTDTLPQTTFPYTLVIDPDVPGKEEIVTVTGKTSTWVYNVVRGSNGTSAVAHDSGAVVKHMVTARDLQEAQDHIDATGAYNILNDNADAGVTTTYITKSLHGLGSSDGVVVGTDKIQVLTNKSLTAPTITGTVNANSATIALGSAGNITANSTTVTAVELSYLNGVTSAIQTQINTKAPIASPTFTGTVTIPTGASITAPTISGGTVSSATLTSATINSGILDLVSTIGGVSGTTLAADRTAWTSYTPAITSWTLGNGTITGAYKQIGKVVFFRGKYTIGSTDTVSTALTISLPVTAVDNASLIAHGRATLSGINGAGASEAALGSIQSSSTTFRPQLINASSTYAVRENIGSGNYTRTAGDVIYFSGTYEAA